MSQFVTDHQFWILVGVYWLFSAAVSGMPEPAADAPAWYVWLYRFGHTIAGNVSTVLGSKLPGLKIPPLVSVLPIMLVVAACGTHYSVHPGALNTVDSAAYDTLLSAQAAIDQARVDFDAGRLSAGSKDALDRLVQSYNIARASWLSYRSASQPDAAGFKQLTTNLADLGTAIRNLKENK